MKQSSSECGHPGDAITIPRDFLMSSSSNGSLASSAKLFAAEFAKLRYGVFDDLGYPGDAMYPSHFKHRGRILPTGAYDVGKVEGTWLHRNGAPGCDPAGGSRCVFLPDPEANGNATCSLGFLPHVTSAAKFCSENSTSLAAPTKHNVLCKGSSAMDVILQHPGEESITRF